MPRDFAASTTKWWRRRESNPRPKAFHIDIYVRSLFILSHCNYANRQASLQASFLSLTALAGNGAKAAILLSDATPNPQEKSGEAWLLN